MGGSSTDFFDFFTTVIKYFRRCHQEIRRCYQEKRDLPTFRISTRRNLFGKPFFFHEIHCYFMIFHLFFLAFFA